MNKPVPFVPKALARRGMPRSLGPILGPFARASLDRIPFPPDDKAAIQKLADEGAVIVWVHRTRNPIEHLALSRVVDREGLPRARYVGGLNNVALQPVWALPALLRGGIGSVEREEELLESCVSNGLCAEIFLRRPLTLLSTTSGYRARWMDVLVRVQKRMLEDPRDNRRIVLVPVFLALAQRPGNFEPTPLDAIFGSVEEPGLLRSISRVLAAGEQARFEVSDAVDLRAFCTEHTALSVEASAKKVRWAVLHHLARVERLFHGPALKSAARMRDDLLRDPRLAAYIDGLAKENGLPRLALEKRVVKIHDQIAARFDIDITRGFSWLLDQFWKRMYDGITVDEDGVRALREAGKRGPLVIVPSHRSHVDYLVLSQIMLKRGLVPPLLAAGENMAFFPMGWLFRRGGAFYLRRTMKGDPFYVNVFKAYVRRVFAEGFSLEFFIEGGRSRTGKTLPPKLGLLSMVVDAFLEGREPDTMFVPCHVSYERVIEAGSYAKELRGSAKRKESAAGMVKAAGVLTKRYGRVFVTFDQPISLADHLAARGLSRDTGIDELKLRAAVQALGHRIVYGINRAGVVTAVSLVCSSLLGFRRRGLDEDLLVLGATLMCKHLQAKPRGSVRFQPGLIEDIDGYVRAAMARLVADELLEKQSAGDRTLYVGKESAALEIDAQKNQLLHHIVPECILACALSASGVRQGAPQPRATVAAAARTLSRVLKLEVIFEVGKSYDELFTAAVNESRASGLIGVDADSLALPDTEETRVARRYARNLILGFVEAYHTVFVLARDASDEKTLAARALAAVQGKLAAGELVCAEAASKVTLENAAQVAKQLRESGELADVTELLARARPRSPQL